MLPVEEARLTVGLLLIIMTWGISLAWIGIMGLAGVFNKK